MNLFNNREIATIIWAFIAIGLILTKSEIRKSLKDLLQSFFNVKIQISIFGMFAYTTMIVYLLYIINLWNTDLLKDTIVWFCFSGIVMCFNMITSSGKDNLYRKIVLENIKLVIILEFIINTYTFSIIGELIFIPVVTFIAIVDAIAQTKEEYNLISKITKNLLYFIGLIIIIYSVSKAISDYYNLGSFNTIRSILLSPLLSISFLPLVYFLLVFSSYENLFIRLELGPPKSSKIKRLAKRKIFNHCKFSLNKIKNASNINIYNIMHIQDEKDIKNMIDIFSNRNSV